MENFIEIRENLLSYFSDLSFLEREHKYFINKKPVTYSVSGLIKMLSNPFNSEVVSMQLSMRDGLPQEKFLFEWEYEKNISLVKGNGTHLFGELYPFNRELIPKTPYENGVKKFWDNLPESFVPIFVELRMYHKKYKFAGTADIILYHKDTNSYIICDYKTNKDLFKRNFGSRLKPPFDKLHDTPFNKYQIQLSFYQILLEQVFGVNVAGRTIIFIKENDYEKYKTTNYTKELKLWLEFNKEKIII